jgi:hypothetical protein
MEDESPMRERTGGGEREKRKSENNRAGGLVDA